MYKPSNRPQSVVSPFIRSRQGRATSQEPMRTLPSANERTQGVVQRVIKGYNTGTLRKNYIVMRGLTSSQMYIVQQLHDDPLNTYTIEEARAVATGISGSSNPYEWEVLSTGSYLTPDSNVQSVLDNFGHPSQPVVKLYEDLAGRVGYDVGKSGKGVLSTATLKDLNLHFEASKPLHFGFNPYLNTLWTDNQNNYTGSKKYIPLYSVLRSDLTQDFKAKKIVTTDLNSIIAGISKRPPEVHHLLFKAHYPTSATIPANLMLAERSQRESEFGPGQHELMHKIASGNNKDKFKVLLPQYTDAYRAWLLSQGIQL